MVRLPASVLVVLLVSGPAMGGELSLDPLLTTAEFGSLASTLADVLTLPTAGPAEPLGVTGFDILAVTGGPREDDGSSWWRHSIAGGTQLGVLAGGRIIARKGLPGGFDLGAQVGEVLGERFWGGEVRWGILGGGTITPALGLRASYTRLDSSAMDLEVAEIQLAISKGFLFATPYASLGMRRSSADAAWAGADAGYQVEEDLLTGSAGVRLTFLPFHVVAEVRQGSALGYFVGLGVGL